MSHDLGDLVPLSVTVTGSDGNPANAGQVDLTITLPDGSTTAVGPIAPTTVGVYDYDFTTVQAGRHQARWVATGANASAFTDAFDVQALDDGNFISLSEVKIHLQKNTTSDDEQLRFFVSAACQMITDRMGRVSPTTEVADRRPHRGKVVLPKRPVISITSVQRLPGLDVVPAADAATGVRGWSLESTEGVLSVTSGVGRVRVTYRAGRNPLPPNIRMAALELVAHLWRGSQHNQSGVRPALGETDALSASVRAYAMPYRVMELLGLKKDQERDEILIG